MAKEVRGVTVYYRRGNLLKLEAQKQAVQERLESLKGPSRILGEFTEKAPDKQGYVGARKGLQKALEHAQSNNSILVIANLGKLQRSLSVLEALAASEVEFVCCDNPHVTRETLPALILAARQAAERVSEQSKKTAEKLRQRGELLGSQRPGHWAGREHKRGWKKAVAASTEARIQRTQAYYGLLLPQMKEWREAGDSHETIAKKLNELGHRTTVGKPFTQVAVYRVLKRAGVA